MAGRAEQDAMEAFVSDLGVDAFPHTADLDGSIWAQFGITSQPAFVFIDDGGTITVHNGGLGPEGLGERIDALRQG